MTETVPKWVEGNTELALASTQSYFCYHIPVRTLKSIAVVTTIFNIVTTHNPPAFLF